VNNIGGNDSNDVVNPDDSGDAFSEVNSLSGFSSSPRSPSEGTAKTPIRWLQLINECNTPVDLQKNITVTGEFCVPNHLLHHTRQP
jgi:hypothetical protein